MKGSQLGKRSNKDRDTVKDELSSHRGDNGSVIGDDPEIIKR